MIRWAVITPENATNRDDLSIEFHAEDRDGDELEVSFAWEGYDSETDTLAGSTLYPVDPLVAAYVTVSDGFEESSFKVTKLLKPYEEFYSDASEVEFIEGQPVSFKVGFHNDDVEELQTKLRAGPSGMRYEDGYVHWTPTMVMPGTINSFYAYFESVTGVIEKIEMLVIPSSSMEPLWTESQSLEIDRYENESCDALAPGLQGVGALCLRSDSTVSCTSLCSVWGTYEIVTLDSDFQEIRSSYLLDYYSDDRNDDGVQFERHGTSLPISGPQGISYLNSNELLISDTQNNLLLVSSVTTDIIWIATNPVNNGYGFDRVTCEEQASDITQCSFHHLNGSSYRLHKTL